MIDVTPPRDERELLERAQALAGLRLAELSARFALTVPPDLRRAKGFVGGLIERALGATAGSRALPDFPELAIELKTLPVDRGGAPVESTFVCTIPLTEIGEVEWIDSRVRRKLAQVLWIPVDGERSIPIAERRIGQPRRILSETQQHWRRAGRFGRWHHLRRHRRVWRANRRRVGRSARRRPQLLVLCQLGLAQPRHLRT